MNRRTFLGTMIFTLGSLPFSSCRFKSLEWKLCLAQWSLHRSIYNGTLKNLEFPAYAKEKCQISRVEYVNEFFFDKAKDFSYLKELRRRAQDAGVENLLIMVDEEGQLGHSDKVMRQKAVDNHKKWVEAAKFLGCHSIRVNGYGIGSSKDQAKQLADGLRNLSSFSQDFDIQIVVENHGGLSSNGKWLADVIRNVKKQNCGTLPDFGNFWDYNRYQGVEELLPFIKYSISAKSYDFDEQGNETLIDYPRMLRLLKKARFNHYIGIEYEGKRLSEVEGIFATKKLIEKTAKTLNITLS